jgi:hypothetical protein
MKTFLILLALLPSLVLAQTNDYGAAAELRYFSHADSGWLAQLQEGGIAGAFGLTWQGIDVGAEMNNDFSTPFDGMQFAIGATATLGFKKFYSLQMQALYPIGEPPMIYRLAIKAKLF